METWQPASRIEVETLLAKGMATLDATHRAKFEAIRVPIRKVAVASCPGEFVFVVAEHDGKVLYYSDVEDGWEIAPLDGSGGIPDRGTSQLELSHIVWQLFGDPNSP